MKALIIGNGAREHAIAHKMSSSPLIDTLYVAEGNAGTASFCKNVAIKIDNIEGLADFVAKEKIDLVVPCSEVPISLGIENAIRERNKNILVFAPSKEGASLESSKAFAKSLMTDLNIPTAKYKSFTSYHDACSYFKSFSEKSKSMALPVIKVDGLAQGKGVFLPTSVEEGLETLSSIMNDASFGDAGSTVVIEARLFGKELSLMAFTDGNSMGVFPISVDYKRLSTHNKGPNTGGMGSFAVTNDESIKKADELANIFIMPIIKELKNRGIVYKGVIYAGLINVGDGFKVLEYNCRLGDPETQSLLECMESDIVPMMVACSKGELASLKEKPTWKEGVALTVVMAQEGYPQGLLKEIELQKDELKDENCIKVFHGGTILKNGKIYAKGGRVLSITTLKESMKDAKEAVYKKISSITFPNSRYRKDIGKY